MVGVLLDSCFGGEFESLSSLTDDDFEAFISYAASSQAVEVKVLLPGSSAVAVSVSGFSRSYVERASEVAKLTRHRTLS